MRVGVNALFLIPGEVGGSETYLTETLRAILRVDAGLHLVLFTNNECDLFFRKMFNNDPRVSFDHLRLRASNRITRIIAEQTLLPTRARRARVDVLWSPGYTAPLSYKGCQAVTIHDMQYRSHPEDLGFLARMVTHVLVCGAARRCKSVLAISEFTKREIIKHTAAKAEKIHVTLEGVDSVFMNEARTGGGIQNPEAGNGEVLRKIQRPYILSIANSYPHKNLARLVDAYALVLDTVPHHLVLVGRPRLGEPAMQTALANIPAGRVQRLEGLSRTELVTLYQSADLFVFPSLYEGFGLPVLEAMMAGTPVVTTRSGSLPEVGGDAVVYADGRNPADLASRIQTVLSWDAPARAAFIDAARRRAQTFSWDATARMTLAGFRAACDRALTHK